jgi:hypothetical protein
MAENGRYPPGAVHAEEETVQTDYPAPSPLDYGQPPASDFRVGDVLGPLIAWGAFAAVVTGSMVVVLRTKQIFLDFNVRVPGVTQLLLNVQGLLSTWYGLTVLWLIPFGVTGLVWPADRSVKRVVRRLGVVLTLLFIAYVVLALGIPMMTLTGGIYSQPTGK